MNINPIQTVSKFNKSSKTSNKASRIDIDFSDVLSNTKLVPLSLKEIKDECWSNILKQINSEPPEDREEDLRIFGDFRNKGYTFFPDSLAAQKKILPCFPPATVPGHIREQFNNSFNNLNITPDQKDVIIDCLKKGYAQYFKEHNNNNLALYDKNNFKDSISFLIKYVEENRQYLAADTKVDIEKGLYKDLYEPTKDFLNNFLKHLK